MRAAQQKSWGLVIHQDKCNNTNRNYGMTSCFLRTNSCCYTQTDVWAQSERVKPSVTRPKLLKEQPDLKGLKRNLNIFGNKWVYNNQSWLFLNEDFGHFSQIYSLSYFSWDNKSVLPWKQKAWWQSKKIWIFSILFHPSCQTAGDSAPR